jgi:hypothetical protein
MDEAERRAIAETEASELAEAQQSALVADPSAE